MAVDLNQDNFEEEVLKSQNPVMIDFWSPQCGPCLSLMPVIDRVEKLYAGKLKVAKVNAVGNRMLCAKLRVMSLPTFLFYKDGVEVYRLTGNSITEEELMETIENLIK